MQQIKFFKGVENDLATLEREINAWLKSSGAKVQTIIGNIAPQTLHSSGGTTPLLGAERVAGKNVLASDVLFAVLYDAKS